MKVFLSYSLSDSEFARKLAADLLAFGVEAWVDVVELTPGIDFAVQIAKAITATDLMLVLVSSRSTLSQWMMAEVEVALNHKQRVIPVIVNAESKAALPPRLRELRWLDLSDPQKYEATLQDFAVSLLALSGGPKEQSGDNKLKGQFAGIEMDELVRRIAQEVTERITQRAESTKPSAATRFENKSRSAKSVFVVMAFTEDMEPVFEGIRDAAAACGLVAKRVKDVVGDYQISNMLIGMIHEAAIIVADLTHERPNVYFELGFARGAGKKVITTARNGTKLHFDVRDWTCTYYSDSRVLERTLKERFPIELADLQQKEE